MMKGGEVIHIQVGQCGNNIGTKYWEVISEEHSIDIQGNYQGKSETQLRRINACYDEIKENKYVPRNIVVDLDPCAIDYVRGSPYGRLFGPDNYVSGQCGTSNNWAKGRYTDGSQIIDNLMDIIRKKAENCNKLQGFQIIHSMGGGTGSGLGTLLMDRVREKYPSVMFTSCSVFPSSKVSDNAAEIYNAVLSINSLIQSTDMTTVIDNESVYNMCFRTLTSTTPTYGDMNHLVAGALSGVTCSYRFPGLLNTSLRKLATNLVLYPRMHFLMTSYAPLTFRDVQEYKPLTVPELTDQLFDPQNLMCAVDPRKGKYLTGAVTFRGDVSSWEMDEQLTSIHMKYNPNFVDWIPKNFQTSLCSTPPPGAKIAGTFLANSTTTAEILRKLGKKFQPMYSKRALIHWYTSEGMDEMEFVEAEANMSDIITEYQQYQESYASE